MTYKKNDWVGMKSWDAAVEVYGVNEEGELKHDLHVTKERYESHDKNQDGKILITKAIIDQDQEDGDDSLYRTKHGFGYVHADWITGPTEK